MKKQFLHLALVLASTLSAISAARAADTFHGVATGGLSYSGEDWQVAKFANGAPVNVHGGGRFEIGAGGAWQAAAYPVMASLVANYQFDPRAGGNTRASFRRAPIDAMVYYTGMETLRFGVGASYILSPSVKATIDGRDETIKFKNGTGKSFEIGYAVAPNVWTNLRLSSEKFKPKSGGAAQEASLSHLAITVSYLY